MNETRAVWNNFRAFRPALFAVLLIPDIVIQGEVLQESSDGQKLERKILPGKGKLGFSSRVERVCDA